MGKNRSNMCSKYVNLIRLKIERTTKIVSINSVDKNLDRLGKPQTKMSVFF